MWVARDDNGGLFCFSQKPRKTGVEWVADNGEKYSLDNRLFPEVTNEPRILTLRLTGDGYKSKRKEVVMIRGDGSRFIYPSITAAATDNNLYFSEVSSFCNGRKYSFKQKKLDLKFRFNGKEGDNV